VLLCCAFLALRKAACRAASFRFKAGQYFLRVATPIPFCLAISINDGGKSSRRAFSMDGRILAGRLACHFLRFALIPAQSAGNRFRISRSSA